MNTQRSIRLVVARGAPCMMAFALALSLLLALGPGVRTVDAAGPEPLFLPLVLNLNTAPRPTIWINEFMADNDSVVADEHGEYDDVIELYNAGPAAVDLGAMYLTDDLSDTQKFRIPDGVTIPAGGYLLFWADGDPAQGRQHTNFSLSKDGESIGLFDTNSKGNVLIDSYTFGPQATDTSAGRCPDGGPDWTVFTVPTMGATNEPCSVPPITGRNGADGLGHPTAVTDQAQGFDESPARQLDYTIEWSGALAPAIGQSGDLGTSTWLPVITQLLEPTPLPLRIDCAGSEPYVTTDGTVYLADRALTASAPYGFLGGYEDLPVEWYDYYPVGNTNEPMLYKTQRLDWQEYRVHRIPNGDYLLTLSFAEQIEHGPGFSVFDIVAEGQTLVEDLDVYAHVGRYSALDRRFAVAVTDGELNVVAVPVAGEPHLAALELEPRDRDSTAPDIPSGLTVTSNYGGVLLDWVDSAEDDLAGYHVYRATGPEGPYTRLTASEPVYWSRADDTLGAAYAPHFYRISAVDVYGNESELSSYVAGEAITAADALLPLFELDITAQNLAILNFDPLRDAKVPATFTWQGNTHDVEVRYRGSASRTFDKKSWKIVFAEGDSPFAYHDRINVNANFMDPSLIRAKLANDLFDAAGLHPPQAEHVLLTLNGEYRGVYTRNEQMDEGFLLRSGRDPGASIYKVNGRFLELLPSPDAYEKSYEKETNEELGYEDIIEFVELVNLTSDEKFADEISQVLDVESFLSYYAIVVLTSHFDSASHNVYLVHDLTTGLWELIPWDLDYTFNAYKVRAAINMGSLDDPDEKHARNVLRSRMLAVPEFREIYCQRLDSYMATIFSDSEMKRNVDTLYAQIASDGQRDWRKHGWESDSALTASPVSLKRFVTNRTAFLRKEMESFCYGK